MTWRQSWCRSTPSAITELATSTSGKNGVLNASIRRRRVSWRTPPLASRTFGSQHLSMPRPLRRVEVLGGGGDATGLDASRARPRDLVSLDVDLLAERLGE